MNKEQAELLELFRDQKVCLVMRINDDEESSNASKLSSLLRFAINKEILVDHLRYEMENWKMMLKNKGMYSKVYIYIIDGKYWMMKWKPLQLQTSFRGFSKDHLEHPVLFADKKKEQEFLNKYS